jgi:iron complex transport system substrate-binding protein
MNIFKESSVCIIQLLILISTVIACTTKESLNQNVTTITELKYAEGFSVSTEGTIKHVVITQPYPGATEGFHYLLVPTGEPIPSHDDKAQVIEVPVKKLVCTSTTHIPLLDYLGATDALIGFPTTDYISSEKMRKRVDDGLVTDLGIDKGMNIELLFSIKPQLVMSYTMTSDLGQSKKIKELGIPVIFNAEYLEKHPLGRAEWIKFMALLLGKEKEADSVFKRIEQDYLATQKLVENVKTKPTVLSGIVYGDAWFMPGGNNYAARLFADAGTRYLWSDTESTGFLELSFESVYEKAKRADLWIGVGSFNSLAEIQAAESRYSLFTPFREKHVYTYNARKGAKGGSEFLELGYLRPDLILKDLVKIGHPDLLPNHTLFFHKRLE